MQLFARKLIRPFAGVTREDIMKEARAIEQICETKHDHIVAVIRHGWLTSSFYYFDMELCELNLEHYITGNELVAYDSRKAWLILKQITNGLDHIHKLNHVHRDMKPRNGTGSILKSSLTTSLIFHSRSELEDCRFRSIDRREFQCTSDDTICPRDDILSCSGIAQLLSLQ